MKTILLAALCAVAWTGCVEELDPAALPSPRAHNSWVHDGAGVVGHREADINRLLDKLERDTGAEVVVVTVPSIGTDVPRDFATVLFNAWGVGKAGKDNGVLILHVIDQRRVEIETGYGAATVLTDARCKQIIDEVTIPFFKRSSFADGHFETVRAVARGLRDGRIGDLGAGFERPPGARVDSIPSPSSRAAVPTRSRLAVPAAAWLLLTLGLGWTVVVVLLALFHDPYTAGRLYRWGALLDFGALGGAAYLITDAIMPGDLTAVFMAAAWLVPVAGMRWLLARWMRARPRKCGDCSRAIPQALGDVEEDEFLGSGAVAEEAVKSVEYDVWHCECGWHRVERIRRWSSYSKCPSCSFRTWKVTSSETITAPTYSSSGTARVRSYCSHCRHSKTEHRTIPMLVKASSSSSSGGGGSSFGGGGSSFGGGSSGGGGGGSSFGGGSSGGGGAGGSY